MFSHSTQSHRIWSENLSFHPSDICNELEMQPSVNCRSCANRYHCNCQPSGIANTIASHVQTVPSAIHSSQELQMREHIMYKHSRTLTFAIAEASEWIAEVDNIGRKELSNMCSARFRIAIVYCCERVIFPMINIQQKKQTDVTIHIIKSTIQKQLIPFRDKKLQIMSTMSCICFWNGGEAIRSTPTSIGSICTAEKVSYSVAQLSHGIHYFLFLSKFIRLIWFSYALL